MGRYSDITVLKTSTGKNYYANVFYPEIPLSESDIYVVTTQGDRLDLLAQQYYGNSTYYWIISAANQALPQNSLFIPPGSQIRIPQNLATVISAYNELNSL